MGRVGDHDQAQESGSVTVQKLVFVCLFPSRLLLILVVSQSHRYTNARIQMNTHTHTLERVLADTTANQIRVKGGGLRIRLRQQRGSL